MGTTHYLWDIESDSYLMEKDGTGATMAVYTNEPIQFGKIISQRQPNQTSYYHVDGQASTRQLSDSDGSVTDEYAYSAFGQSVVATGGSLNSFRFVGILGYCLESATTNYYVRARTYDVSTGRWMSYDPTATNGGTGTSHTAHAGFGRGNYFTYCDSNPLTQIDPSGLSTIAIPQWCYRVVPYCRYAPCLAFEIIDETEQERRRTRLKPVTDWICDFFPPPYKPRDPRQQRGTCICFYCDPPVWDPYKGYKNGSCLTDAECKAKCILDGYKTGVCSFK